LTSIGGWHRHISVDASKSGIAGRSLAHVRVVANAVGNSAIHTTGAGVTSVLHALVRGRHRGGGKDTTLHAIASEVLAHVGVVGDAVGDSVGNDTSSRGASILITHVRGGYGILGGGTALDRIASVGVAKISLVAGASIRGERRVHAKILGRISGIDHARVSGTQVVVVTGTLVGSRAKNASHEEGSLDGSSRRLASKVSTHGVGRNRVGNMRTSSNRVAGVGVALVSLLAHAANVS
jgi:hypothetical protein